MNYHILNSSIVLNYLGKTVVISQDDKRYEAVIDCIRNGNKDDIPAIVEVERAFEGTGLELKDGLIYEGSSPIPPQLNDRILKYKELGLPYDSLLKFWENLKANPSYNSRQQLFKFLEHNHHPITDDGCFIAYRGVTAEFKDKHSGTFDNSVGSVCKEDRALVDDNPNNTCSRGLHVACFNYANGFGEVTVEVKVNPRDVVCVPTDYNGTKMRVCEFTVMATCDNPRTETVYGHPDPAQAPQEDLYEEEEEEEEEEQTCECGEPHDDFQNFCSVCGRRL